ncbi:MAG: glutathione transferase GstA [Kofleriaceae bacterium]|nr:glutathione transferase GstA [Kofleriaceae bacterium]
MKLYYSPAACSLAVHIVAREANIPVELIRVDISTHRLEDGTDFYSINPRGYVPVLELEDGTRITEVAALVQYIADRAPELRLIPPAGTLARVRVHSWLTFVSSELHKGFGPLWHKDTAESTKQNAVARLMRHFAELDVQLARQPYLMGDTYTVADAYAFTILNWSRMVRVDLTPFPALGAYVARIASRPRVAEALATEGLVRKAA